MQNIFSLKNLTAGQENKNLDHNIRVDILASFAFGIYAGILFPFFPALAVRQGVEGLLLALITASPFMGHLFAVYWGHRCECGSKKKYMFISGLISRFLLITLGLFSTPAVFAIMIIMHFMIAAVAWPAYTGLIKSIYPPAIRGRIMGLVQMVIGLVRVFVTYGAGLMLDSWGYGTFFIIAGIAGITASFIIRYFREDKESMQRPAAGFSFADTAGHITRDRGLRYSLLSFFIFDLGNLILLPVYPYVQVTALGLSNFQIGQLSIFWMIGWLIFSPIWGNLVDRRNPLSAVKTAIFLFTISPLIYLMQPPFYVLPLASLSAGAAGAALEVGWINQMIVLGGDKSSTYSGIYLTLLGFRGLLGSLIGGVLLGLVPVGFIFLLTLTLLLVGLLPLQRLYYLGKIENAGEVSLKSRD